MLRGLLASYAAVAYALFAVVRASGAPPLAYAALVPMFALLAVVFVATSPKRPEVGTEPAARKAARAVATTSVIAGIGLYHPELFEGRLAAAIGSAGAGLAGLVAVRSVPAEQGLVSTLAAVRRHRFAIALATLAWTITILVPLLEVRREEVDLGFTLPSQAFGLVLSASSFASAALTLAIGALDRHARRLELGAGDRLRAFVMVAATIVLVAVAAGVARLVPAPLLFSLCAVSTALTAAATATTRSPEAVGRLATHVAILAILSVLPSILLAAVAKTRPDAAAFAVVTAAFAAAMGGLAAPAVARWLLPRAEPWTQAFEAATRAAVHPDPEPALERVLLELRGLSKRKLEAPLLFRFEPATVMSVDLGGYARTEEVVIPESLAELAAGETEAVVSAEGLRACAVRRPDVRPALAWLDDRRLAAVVVMREDGIPIGMLGLPRGNRVTVLTLSEVRALGHLGRLLGAQVSAAAKIARASRREATATERAERNEARSIELAVDLERERDRGEAICRVLSDRARVANYSPASRLAVDQLEVHGRAAYPLSIIAPLGVDPLPYLSIFHLASTRKSSALYMVEGRRAELRDLERWRSETESPFVLARGGTLVIADPHLLPRLVQAYIAAAAVAEEDRGRAERVRLAVVVPRTLDALVARGALDERFADALGDRALALPPLSARAEDLRPLVLDRLTRIGLDRFGRAIGIEPSAMALLAEYEWPGNDVELDAVLARVGATLPEGAEVVRRQDLVRAGFNARTERGAAREERPRESRG